MKLTDKIGANVYVYDIETFLRLGYFLFYNCDTNKFEGFEISRRKNQLFEFIDFLNSNENTYFVGYNNLNFDGQVIAGILKKHKFWSKLTAEEIVEEVYKLASHAIYLSNNESLPEYREDQLFGIQIDLFKLLHLDNKHRRTSLKSLQVEINFSNVQENPVDFKKDYLTDGEIDMGIKYCENDVLSTYEVFKIALGDTNHPLYKENNQLEMRYDIKEEYGISPENFSDSKIGDELTKLAYCQETGLKYQELPRSGTFRRQIKLKNCIPSYVEFQTEQLKTFLSYLRNKVLTKNETVDEEIVFKGVTYSFKSGGLHSQNKNERYKAEGDMVISDVDASSYYPALAINNAYYPKHLGKAFLNGYKALYNKRIELKPLAKKDKRIKGIVNAIKLSVNSIFGKSGDPQSWLFDKQMTVSICIAGELTLMMLIEAYELAGIKVFSANT